MRALVAIILAAGVSLASTPAHADYKALDTLMSLMKSLGSGPPCPLFVTASGAVHDGVPKLEFTVTNTSSEAVTIDEGTLPWDGPYGVTIAALDGKGKSLEISYPIWDAFPPFDLLIIAPGKTLRGSYDITWRLTSRAVSDHKEMTVLWAYPVRLHGVPWQKQPICSGIAYISKQ
jgi:hypothetical protein